MSSYTDSLCHICKHPVAFDEDYNAHRCSEFCAETTVEVKKKLATMKPGDWGVYPCCECGAAVEDEYPETNTCCAGCWPRLQVKLLKELLIRCECYVPVHIQDEIKKLAPH